MGVVALLCMVLLMVLAIAPATPLKNDTACYGTQGAGPCFHHELRCDAGKVFIVQALRGFTPGSSACSETFMCPPDTGSCCQPQEGDCMEAYSAFHFQELYRQCWNKTSCSYTVPDYSSESCGRGFQTSSGYSQTDYVCLTDSSITDFQQTTPVRGSGVAVAYSHQYSNREGRLSCRVDSASCSKVSTNVLLYRGACQGSPRFTTLHLNGDQLFNCSESSNFAAVRNVSTPFTVSLEVVPQITVNEAWVVVQGSDTDVLTLTCGYQGDTAGTAPCPEPCPRLTESSPYGSFMWPETAEGGIARLQCPNGTVTPGFNASRQCSRLLLEVSWRPSRLHGCRLATEARHALRDMASQLINASNALAVLQNLVNVTRDAATFSRDDVSLAVYIALSLLQQPRVVQSREHVVSMVTVLDNLLGAPKEEVTSEAGAKLLEAISLVGREASLSGGKLQTVQPRLALVAVPLPPSQSFLGLQLTASTPPNSSLDASKVRLSNWTSSSEATERYETAIRLPSDLLKSLPAEISVTRITFAVFQNADLFTAIGEDSREGGSNDTRFISSPVVAAAVPGLHLQNLSSPVLISLPHHKLGVDPQCVFWRETLSGGHWSSQGCEVRETDDWHTLCACTHLTNFALLMDVYQTGGQLSQTDMRALSIISMVGCVLSLLGLLLTLLTFCLFRNLRSSIPSKIHMNLCTALALSNIIFVTGFQDYTFGNPIACKAVAALLHLCLLSAMVWTSVEAFYLYLALVKVYNIYTHRFLLKCALVAWGVPFLIVVLTLGINKTNNYGLQDSGVCWLGGAAFYGAFAGPVLLLLLCNFLGFGLALHRILTRTSTAKKKGASSVGHISLGRQLRGAIGVLVLLGLTWIFAIFAIGGASVVFHYLFAIFNSLQGLFIFIFHCLLKKDARTQWRHLLSCSCARTIRYRISHSGTTSCFRRFTSEGTASASSGADHHNKSADTHDTHV